MKKSLSLSFVILTLLTVCNPISTLGAARILYVDAQSGDDSRDGLTSATAWKSLQFAVKSVQPGDTVQVAPGVYYGPVELRTPGTAQMPIVFRATELGENKVVLTNADPAIREKKSKWTPVDAQLGLYSIPYEKEMPARVLYSGIDLYPYATLEKLKAFSTSIGQPGPRHGYTIDPVAKLLYVRLHDGGKYGSSNPNEQLMAVAPATGKQFDGTWIDSPAHYNFGLLGSNPAYATLDGFTFETPGVAGVYVQSSHVTVRRSWFRGCRTGVCGNYTDIFGEGNPDGENYYYLLYNPEGIASSASAITIEYCEFTQQATFDDVVELLSVRTENSKSAPYWHRKSISMGLPSEHFKYEIGIACRIGRDWIIRRNYIHDAFEGLSCHATSSSENLLVEENIFERLCDNAVESEDHAKNMRVVRNVITDVLEPFSWQPIRGIPWPGPIYFVQNIVTTSPRYAGLWKGSLDARGTFKIGISVKGWDTKPGLKGVPKSPLVVPAPGMFLAHNTVIAPGLRLITLIGDGKVPVEGVQFINNVLATDYLLTLTPPKGELLPDHFAFSNNAVAPATNGLGGPTKIAAGNKGVELDSPAAFQLDAQFRPAAKSPLRGKAQPIPAANINLSDLGAIQPGDAWYPLQVGPLAAPTTP